MREFAAAGLTLIDGEDRWRWGGGLDGVPLDRVDDWDAGQESLYWRLRHVNDEDLNLVAHSYGGAVAILLALRRRIRTLITVGTPPRKELRAIAREALARGHLPIWVHYYGAPDWIRSLGTLFDGELRWSGTFRLPHMSEQRVPGIRHSRALYDPSYQAVRQEWAAIIGGSPAPLDVTTP